MTNRELMERAKKLMPGGVSSPVRAFKAVGGEPIVVREAKGCRLWDVEGKEYIDFLMSWGPLILGHAHPYVVSEVERQLSRGMSYGLTCYEEIRLAELVVSSVPSVEMVRFVSSGTEATMSAIRLARGYTGRKFVVKFEGCYHGHYDGLLVSAGSGVATLGIPGTPGVPEEIAGLTLVLPYNDTDAVLSTFERYGEDIACVIVEPVAGNMGVVLPSEGFLEVLREVTRKYGAVLIFDEVITNFRLSVGGAQEYYAIDPDITCMGKILGGGMPLGAYGGKKEIMSHVAPEGKVYQAGTLSGNPVSVVCGRATLEELLRLKPYQLLEERTRRLAEGISTVLKEKGIPHTINRIGSMFTVFFTEVPVTDYASSRRSNTELFGRFFRNLLHHGVLIPPSQFEAWFLSTAHRDEDIEEALERIQTAVRSL
ncbi:glutamate-1-semialdehyde-2,1-aminomutase [Thermocrinis albus DSM 14484]|uniref:Glutamate-1-semialdehyde 2,1-aminomutase n=1 Tax=Thermocrinis albus (strain DSM 14484 / JCM 11386 / HI 11/12) TaxID=638303 RepID=D3SPL6_THEAH|nr:glutamate-1-semialdehyde 2,1-aminomutase [Thermocrinis albus]ADC89103.1 glutamate-1-semialdehyde-2,1-aminomutase [Thermocrinis albus DSM 14484]